VNELLDGEVGVGKASQLRGIGHAVSRGWDDLLLDLMILAVRFPCAMVAQVFVLAFYGIWFALECVLLGPAFVCAAIFSNRDQIKQTWVGRFPNSLRYFFISEWRLIRWALDPRVGSRA
jgi:hypothetical protein